MNPMLLAGRLGNDERRLRAAFGWMSGLDPSLLAWDTGLDPIASLHGAATDDGVHTWEVLRGTWGRSSAGWITAGGSLDNRAAVIDVGQQNVMVAVDIGAPHGTGGRDAGVVLRASEDAWLIVSPHTFNQGPPSMLYLQKVVSGIRTQLASISVPDLNQFFPLRLFAVARGSAITAGINGIPLLRYRLTGDDQSIFIGTRVGLGTVGSDVGYTFKWRNFAVWRSDFL